LATLSRTAPKATTAQRLKAAKKRRKPSKSAQAWRLASYAILIVGGLVFIGPWAWMVVASFKDISEMFQYPPSW